MRRPLRAAAPAVIAAVLTLAAWLAFGVTPGVALRFAAYEIAFVVLPGGLAVLALSPRPGWARAAALGGGLGTVLAVFAYALATASGLRSAFALYPLIVGGLAVPVLARRWRFSPFAHRPGEGSAVRSGWALLGAYALILLLIAAGYFAAAPLPGTVPAVNYYHDLVWTLGFSAEALHHWPVTDPHAAGEPFAYYKGVFFHLAAAAQITGLDLPLLLLRLYVLPLTALLVIQVYALGVTLSGERRIGLAAVLMVLLVGEVDPFTPRRFPYRIPFSGLFFDHLLLSPTFLLGMVCFLPLLILLLESLRADTPPRRGEWLAIALLLAGCGAAKGSILPVIAGGLVIYGLAQRGAHRRDWLPALALTGLVWGYFWQFVYDSGSISTAIRPLAALRAMDAIRWLETRLPGAALPRALILAPALLGGVIGLLGVRLVGLGWLARAGWPVWSRGQRFLLALFAASLIPWLLLDVSGQSQWYFFWYGEAALGVLAAQGVVKLRRARPRRAWTVLALALLIPGLLDAPLDLTETVQRALRGQPTYSADRAGLTRDLWRGLTWGRDHTPPGAIFAVNNQTLGATGDARYFYYSAFLERRIFLEGYLYTNASRRAETEHGGPPPFPERQVLNDRVFVQGDPAAMRELAQRFGVTYLLVDRVHGPPAPDWGGAARELYANADVAIYAITTGPQEPPLTPALPPLRRGREPNVSPAARFSPLHGVDRGRG